MFVNIYLFVIVIAINVSYFSNVHFKNVSLLNKFHIDGSQSKRYIRKIVLHRSTGRTGDLRVPDPIRTLFPLVDHSHFSVERRTTTDVKRIDRRSFLLWDTAKVETGYRSLSLSLDLYCDMQAGRIIFPPIRLHQLFSASVRVLMESTITIRKKDFDYIF